jgi:hypothetical protein
LSSRARGVFFAGISFARKTYSKTATATAKKLVHVHNSKHTQTHPNLPEKHLFYSHLYGKNAQNIIGHVHGLYATHLQPTH